ncbi:MAG TPA: transcriptional regulator GutM [Candidatus Paceibacterota bacterium]|nr:transcriptional regulator GutM [Candidatus Paceibacterota bacterium]
MTNLTRILLVIAAMWAAQVALAFMQAKRFQADLSALRKLGTVAVGMGGRRYRGGRAFVALTVDGNEIVQDGLVLKGFTVFANSRKLNNYIGFSLDDILSGKREGVDDPNKVREAAVMSAQHIKDYLSRSDQGEKMGREN